MYLLLYTVGMNEEFWRQALANARNERQTLITEREALEARQATIEQRVLQLEQTINSLSDLLGEHDPANPLKGFGAAFIAHLTLSGACEEVLKSSGRYMTPIEVREALRDKKYDFSKHTNILASIHGVLKRLAEQENAVTTTNLLGDKVYRWNAAKKPLPRVRKTKGRRKAKNRLGVAAKELADEAMKQAEEVKKVAVSEKKE